VYCSHAIVFSLKVDCDDHEGYSEEILQQIDVSVSVVVLNRNVVHVIFMQKDWEDFYSKSFNSEVFYIRIYLYFMYAILERVETKPKSSL